MARYNGWKNYQTWNVALWIGNDEGLYNLAREMKAQGYGAFAKMMREDFNSIETADGVAWNDSGLDTAELDEMMGEL